MQAIQGAAGNFTPVYDAQEDIYLGTDGIRSGVTLNEISTLGGIFRDVAYNPATGIEQIMTQKWLANFLNGYEAWFDFRRTGYPALAPTRDNLNNDVIPSRYKYPVSEQAVNKVNYESAVSRLGEDSYNIKSWWEAE